MDSDRTPADYGEYKVLSSDRPWVDELDYFKDRVVEAPW